eukprot:1167119-Ditylum_brightwellii.AAC.1
MNEQLKTSIVGCNITITISEPMIQAIEPTLPQVPNTSSILIEQQIADIEIEMDAAYGTCLCQGLCPQYQQTIFLSKCIGQTHTTTPRRRRQYQPWKKPRQKVKIPQATPSANELQKKGKHCQFTTTIANNIASAMKKRGLAILE